MSVIEQKTKKNKAGRDIIIRTAILKDARDIIKINKEIVQEGKYILHEPDEYKPTMLKEKTQIRNLRNTNGSIYLIAEINKKITGYLTFKKGGVRRTSHLGYISIFIKRKYREKGIGRLLMEELTEWAKQNPEIEKLSLLVFANNKRAIELYKKTGFKTEGILRKDMKIDGNYIDSILMYKFV